MRGLATAPAVVLAAVLLASGCATPVGVERVDGRTVHRELTASALSSGGPSASTRLVLHRLGFFEAFERRPEETLQELRRGLATTGDEDRVFALAELHFLHGAQARDRAHYLAAAVYAWAFLFPGEQGAAPDAFDPRFRLACDLYNRGLNEGLSQDEEVDLGGGRLALPFGTLEVRSRAGDFRWAGQRVGRFVPAAELRVRGLRNRYRHAGIGAPLAAALLGPDETSARPPGYGRIPPRLRVPVTALLRLPEARRSLLGDTLHGTLDLHSPEDAQGVEIDGREVPLEFETTASLALGLDRAAIWDFELQGFRSGERRFLPGELSDGLFLMHPYRRGRIPVVLVHGTASSPGRWAELLNEIENDPRLRNHYQVWLFIYNTGNPVALSGALLREALTAVVTELDPDALDPALRRMVVVGHSQGGLLTKLTAIDSGDRFWRTVSDEPLASFDLDPETRELLQRALFVKPVPGVRRLVFVATPHRGSYLTVMRWAGFSPASWVKGLIELPGFVSGMASEIVLRNPNAKFRRRLDRVPTSIDNMTPGNPFLQTLAETPVAPGVTTHSIIAVKGDGPPEEGDDGVVEYSSAHFDGAASELVVRSSHSVQANPAAIEEVRRILLEHLAAAP